MNELIRELINAKKDSDRANKRLKEAKAAVESIPGRNKHNRCSRKLHRRAHNF